jgi:hypothetical protein
MDKLIENGISQLRVPSCWGLCDDYDCKPQTDYIKVVIYSNIIGKFLCTGEQIDDRCDCLGIKTEQRT